MVRGTLRQLLATALIATVFACASPTLPLPPPATPTVSTSPTMGKVHLSSTRGAEPNAIVLIINQNPNVPRDQRVGGTIADEEGSWDADVIASPGDVLEITQEFGSEKSPPILVQVR